MKAPAPQRGRLRADPTAAVVTHIFGPQLDFDRHELLPHMLKANEAHAIVLAGAGLLDSDQVRVLLAFCEQTRRDGEAALDLDPRYEDLYLNLDRLTARAVGEEAGGRLHTGRSRNDLGAAMTRMWTRSAILRIADSSVDLRTEVLRLAARHVDTVMTGYTHTRPAQPITLGYYLSAIADALKRDTQRLRQSYDSCNKSPLGAAALAGSSFHVDRFLEAELLGFDGLVENALDAVASRDFLVESLSAALGLTVTISRLAQDLYIWSTEEFGLVALDDSVSHTSSVMPQKHNPLTLEHCKARAAQVLGTLVAAVETIRATSYSHGREVSREATYLLTHGVTAAVGAAALMTDTLRTVAVDAARMQYEASRNFSTMTHLAAVLVTDGSLPFRSAHAVVGHLVSRTVSKGDASSVIQAEDVRRSARAVLGRDIELSDAAVRSALDVASAARAQATFGSTNPDEVRRMVRRARRGVSSDRSWLRERRAGLEDADRRLSTAVTALREGRANGATARGSSGR